MIRILTVISGVLAVVLPNVGSWGLPVSVQVVITAVGGALLTIFATLEHPTVKAVTAKPVIFSSTPPPKQNGA